MKKIAEVKRIGAAGVLLVGILLFATTAIASITAGSSNISLSQDVAYTQVSLNKPSDAVTGDFLIAAISVNGGAPASITSPSGWTLIARTDNDSNIGIASYYKFIDASEPASYTWTISPQTRAVGGVTRYTGIAPSPIDAAAGSTGRGTTATALSVTTSRANATVIALFAANIGTNNSSLFSTSTGMTVRYGVKNTPFGPTAAAEDLTQAVAGAAGSFSSKFSTGPQRDWAAQTIALRPAGPYTHRYTCAEMSVSGGTCTNDTWSGSGPFSVFDGGVNFQLAGESTWYVSWTATGSGDLFNLTCTPDELACSNTNYTAGTYVDQVLTIPTGASSDGLYLKGLPSEADATISSICITNTPGGCN